MTIKRMNDSDICLIHSTFPNEGEAFFAARILVEQKLAACVSTHPATSIYRWEGALTQSSETMLLAKTTHAKSAAAVACIKARHPDRLPCILITQVTGGHAPFLQWLRDETV